MVCDEIHLLFDGVSVLAAGFVYSPITFFFKEAFFRVKSVKSYMTYSVKKVAMAKCIS